MQVLINQEFTYRQSPAEQDGYGKFKALYGNTLAWNQLIRNGNFADTSNWSAESGATLSISNNIATISSTTASNGIRQYLSNSLTVNHKYLVKAEFNVPTEYRCVIGTGANQGVQIEKLISTANTWTEVIGIGTCTASTTAFYCFVRGTTYENVKIRNVMCIDLTQMGLNITDPSDFTSLFNLPYYAYNQGSLLSFMGNGIKTVGKNLLPPSESFSSVPDITISADNGVYTLNGTPSAYRQAIATDSFVLESGTYRFSKNSDIANNDVIVQLRSVDGLTIYAQASTNSGETFTLADRTEIKFRIIANANAGTLNNYIIRPMLEFGSVATDYEPYTSSTLSLPISTYFPTGMKSAGTAYDELTPNKATTRLKEVTFSSVSAFDSSGKLGMLGSVADAVNITGGAGATTVPNDKSVFETYSLDGLRNNDVNGITQYGKYLYVRLQGKTTLAEYNTYLSANPLTVIYELATPTETSFTTASLVTENPQGLVYPPQSKEEYPFFKTYKGGTEQLLPENGSVPTTAPIICDLMYSSGAIQVTTYPNPEHGGETSGDGWYLVGEEATVNATPNEHYVFNNWVLDGEIVSTDPEYTFEVKDE